MALPLQSDVAAYAKAFLRIRLTFGTVRQSLSHTENLCRPLGPTTGGVRFTEARSIQRSPGLSGPEFCNVPHPLHVLESYSHLDL